MNPQLVRNISKIYSVVHEAKYHYLDEKSKNVPDTLLVRWIYMFYPQITLQKTVCLLGVIFYHSLLPFSTPIVFWKTYAAQPSVIAEFLFIITDTLNVPSFFFASGFLLAQGRAEKVETFGRAVYRRSKRLLLPWLMTTLFWLVPLYVFFDLPAHMHPAGTPLLETYGTALRGLFVENLWFLLVLFWTTVFWLVCLPLVEKWGRVAGCVLAVVAAVAMQQYGQSLTWYCLGQTTAPLVYFYLGYLAYHYRQILDALLTHRRVFCLSAMLVVVGLCIPWMNQHYAATWILSSVGCLFTYQCSLLALPSIYEVLKKNSWYMYFEKNSFRYYLFHMPPTVLVFMGLNTLTTLSPIPFIALSFALTLAVTTGIVWVSHAFDRS